MQRMLYENESENITRNESEKRENKTRNERSEQTERQMGQS